ncbi:MAG: hypothetical protein IPM92_03040 [Saprospiraceae bacterium]|nr:hypothetical protein [Saprospiraceae bacterium]
MITRFGIITLIIFCSELIFCQSHWQKINSEQFQKCEDIAISNDGEIYVALRYKNIILESKDQGNSWLNIVNDTFTYNPLHYTKELYIDDKNRLVQFFNDGGLFFGRFYEENEGFKLLDSVIQLQLLYNTIKYDENGISYTFQGNRIIRYNRNWSEVKDIIVLPDKIEAIFPYTEDINYALCYANNEYIIYKFNTTNLSYVKVNTLLIISSVKNFYISKQGHVFVGNGNGLFISNNPAGIPKRIQIDPKYSISDPVRNLVLTKRNQVIVRTDNSCFITYDEGQSWTEISDFNINFPSKFSKIEALDSSLAIAMVNEDNCGHIGMRIFRSGKSGWTELKLDYSLWNFSNVFKNAGERLFAKPDYCSFLYSENEGATWDNLMHDGAELNKVFPLHNKELVGIDINSNILISNDNGNKFQVINFSAPEIHYIGNLLNKNHFSLLFFGMKDVAGDFIDTVITYKYENNNWALLGGGNLPNPQVLRYYLSPTNKLYAYSYTTQDVYVSANEGISWSIDTTFKDFKRIVDLRIENNGTILVSGEKYNRETNLFESDGGSDFIPTSSYFENKFIGIYDKYYPKIIAINNIGGISISNDGGHIWNDFNSGLPIFGKEFVIYNSLFWDSEDYIFVSIAYDGLYKSVDKITKVNELIKSNWHSVFPNPFNDHLSVELDTQINAKGAVLNIYTLSGIAVQRYSLASSKNKIKLESNLNPGYYLYNIRLPDGKLLSGKLVKI